MGKGDEIRMRKTMKIIVIVFGALVIGLLTIPVFATTMTTVSFGIDANPQPLLTIRGLYDERRTEFSGLNYHLQLDTMHGTFSGWFKTAYGERIDAHGTYEIENHEIHGRWFLSSGQYGWISGHIGI